MKIVSQLDEQGYFVAPVEAQESPLEPGVFLIPGGAVDREPPKVIEPGKRYRVWGQGWRGEVPAPEPEPEPAPLPEKTEAEIIDDMKAGMQAHMDTTAQAYGYDSIQTAVTYADEPAVPKFQAEGAAFRAWRSMVWAAGYQVLDDVMTGARAAPTLAELLAELPAFEAPAQ